MTFGAVGDGGIQFSQRPLLTESAGQLGESERLAAAAHSGNPFRCCCHRHPLSSNRWNPSGIGHFH